MVRKRAHSGERRARAAAVAGAGAERNAGGRHRVAPRIAGRVPAADARWVVRAAGMPWGDSRAALRDAVPKAARTGSGRAVRRPVVRAAAYRADRQDADSQEAPGAGRQEAGAVRQAARRTAGFAADRAPGSGHRARGAAAGSRHTDPPLDAGPDRGPDAGPAGRGGVRDRPAGRAGAAGVAARGRNRGRYRAGGRSSPAPLRETEAPAPTVRWVPAGLVDRRAVYRAAADERRIHRRSSCLLYRPDPRLPVVPCVVPNTSPPLLLRATNCTVRTACRIRPRTRTPDGPEAPVRAPPPSSM